MPNKVSVQQIPFKDEDAKLTFGTMLKKLVDDSIRDRAEMEKAWVEHLQQYEGRLKRKDNPPTWASNIDIPTTRENVQAVVSRIVNPIIQQDRVMACKPRNANQMEFARQLEDFYDYAFDQIDTLSLFNEWITSAAIFGFGVIKVPWTHRTRVIKEWVEAPDPMTGQVSLREVTSEVDEICGPDPQVIQTPDLIWPLTVSDLQQSPWLGHRLYFDESTVQRRVKDKEWDAEAVKKVKWLGQGEVDAYTREKETLIGVEPQTKRGEFIEMYIQYDVDQDGVDEDLIVTFDRHSGVIVRGIYNYLHDFRMPFLFHYLERRPGSNDGISLCYTLKPLHVAYSQGTNMQLDAAGLATKGWIVYTNDQHFADNWKSANFNMGDVIQGSGLPKDSVQILTFGQTQSNMSELMDRIRFHQERCMSTNDTTFGQNDVDRQTASGQSLQVAESSQPLQQKLQKFRDSVARLALMVYARYKQFYQNKFEYWNMISDSVAAPTVFEFPPGIIEDKILVETTATTANMNEAIRRQEIVGLMDRMSQVYGTLQGMIQSVSEMTMQGSPSAMAMGGLMDGYIELTNRLLREFKVENQEALMPEINGLMMAGQNYAMIIQQLQGQLEQAMGYIQQMQGGGENANEDTTGGSAEDGQGGMGSADGFGG